MLLVLLILCVNSVLWRTRHTATYKTCKLTKHNQTHKHAAKRRNTARDALFEFGYLLISILNQYCSCLLLLLSSSSVDVDCVWVDVQSKLDACRDCRWIGISLECFLIAICWLDFAVLRSESFLNLSRCTNWFSVKSEEWPHSSVSRGHRGVWWEMLQQQDVKTHNTLYFVMWCCC